MFLPDLNGMFGGGEPGLYCGLAFLLLLCGLCAHTLVSRQSAQYIPGPFLARWSHLWLAYHAYRGRRYKAVHAAHSRYGVLVRIAPNHISVAAPEALSVIYGQGPRAPAKSPFYDSFVCNGKPSIFSTRDRQDHSTKRRVVSHAFSSSALQEFIPLIHSTIGDFTQRMDEFSRKGEYFDALLWFNYLAFDVLSDLAFGERIGMLNQGSDLVEIQRAGDSSVQENAIALVDEREHLAAIVGIHPFLQVVYNSLPFLSGNKATSGLEELARRQVLKRLSSGANRNDILGKLIAARGYDVRSPNTDEVAELTSEAVTLLIAGSDTTSNSIAVTLHFIATNPRVYTKLMELLLEASSGQNELSYEQAKDVPYLQATINEGLRLHSTTAIGLHRSAPSGGLVVCGHFFPEGTELSVPAWTIGHDAELWGDPHVFRPERWLESKESRQYLLAFGKGPRACIGQNLAYIEMISILATILLRYNVEVRSQVLQTTEGFMHKPLDCWIKLSLR
ncbi:benzoate para-hydroxylase [Mycena albidolilacea]|uniref:Benzoate para-hydroxylase n=1 Tax=Mycena albidolilacea TaxID=1033008 RepID=A0AAD7EJ30_9AGAR|nr:benzoate para-hydroxylase [Mycena albidolilacea]